MATNIQAAVYLGSGLSDYRPSKVLATVLSCIEIVRVYVLTPFAFLLVFALTTQLYMNSDLHLQFSAHDNSLLALTVLSNFLLCVVLFISFFSPSDS